MIVSDVQRYDLTKCESCCTLFQISLSVRSSFDLDNIEGVLLVDASNAINSSNRAVALQNIHQLCPSFAPILINTYRSAAALYTGGDILFSEEGTTQGDPLAMPVYALATLLLSDRLPNTVTQVWYADDMCVPVDLLSSCMIGGTISTRLVQGSDTMLVQARPGW